MRRNDAHAGTDFIGPECKKILDGVDKLAAMTSVEARAMSKRSLEESTVEERRQCAPPPPDPHEAKENVPDDELQVHLRVLRCCSAMSNFNHIMRMTKPGANTEAFEEAIAAFGANVTELLLKTTLKMHIIDDHLATFVKSIPRGFSLAAYSEQAFETCHYYHELFTRRCNVPKAFRKHASKSVLRSVTMWNSSRISYGEYAILKKSRAANE